mmetsp:Transcript_43618/g.79498  ORF Transcript_43618/g.79498 Transcript_43618/m.79498 type:complete len:232 (-) Transcript_43618:2188-2883(-)
MLRSALTPPLGWPMVARGVRNCQALAERELAIGDTVDIGPPALLGATDFRGCTGPPPRSRVVHKSSNCDRNWCKVVINSARLGSVDLVGLLSTAPIQKSTTRISSSSTTRPKSGDGPVACEASSGRPAFCNPTGKPWLERDAATPLRGVDSSDAVVDSPITPSISDFDTGRDHSSRMVELPMLVCAISVSSAIPSRCKYKSLASACECVLANDGVACKVEPGARVCTLVNS